MFRKSVAVHRVALLVVVSIAMMVWTQGARAQSNYKSLYKFTGGTDGSAPWAGLIADSSGNLYGATLFGGNLSSECLDVGCGVVFELTPNQDGSWTKSVLHSFGLKDGANPSGALILDGTGNLYGTTESGGALKCNGQQGCGVVFQLTPHSDGSWTESVLHSFSGGSDGANPNAALIFDQAGNLYGTTSDGGIHGAGTVFELIQNADGGWKEEVLHHFTGGKDGAHPFAGLIFDTAGNLYSTTWSGGAHDFGTVFELIQTRDGWKEKILHTFTNGKDGAYPYAGLIFDQVGNLYGTASSGGNLSACEHGCGVAFKLAPKSKGRWNEIVLHYFADHPGAIPISALIFDGTGKLYGTTSGFPPTVTFGSVFEITQ